MISKDNKLIYKNTIIIYVRMIIVTIVGLVSSRFVLQALGVSDYGLYNVVGGLIAMLNFISTAMATTTRRFINVEMGKQDGNLNKIFNISLLLHAGFALLILLVAETIGIWYISNMLNVAEGKLGDAMFVFQISTVVACIGIINVPFQSLIEANEQFGKAAIIDITTTLLKFVLVIILLVLYEGNALRFYAISMCVVTFFSFLLYHGVCHRRWPSIIRLKFFGRSSLYKEIFIFNNYTALGAIASIGKSQGSNLLINFFFGTIANAAFAIAYQVENYVYMFVNKLTLAANPQIAKNYYGNTNVRSIILMEKNSRYSILIMTCFFFAIVPDIDFILTLWLKEVPQGASFLCFLTLVDALVKSFNEGSNGYIQASGKIKWFQISNSVFLISILPIAYVLFLLGYDAFWIIVCFIISSILNRVFSLFLMKKLLYLNIHDFVKKAYTPPLVVISIMSIITLCYRRICITPMWLHFLGIIIILLFTIIICLFFGMNKEERQVIINLFIKKVFKK